MTTGGTCSHDYDNAIRTEKMKYICPKCKRDITLIILLMEEEKVKQHGL
jgi:hypothetical protein